MYTLLLSIAALVAVTVLVVLALIYALSGFIGRSDIKVWVRVKIFDTLISLMLIAIFMYAAANILYKIPLGYLNTAKLVPPPCASATSNLYSLSTCDMYQFNVYTDNFEYIEYWGSMLLSIVPQLTWQGGYQSPYEGQDTNIVGGAITLTLLPPNLTFKYLGAALDALFVFSLANGVQLIILSASAIILAILMSLGLLARMFGITKTFGGAMIAFAFGLGIIYPLLTTLTYGFIDYGISSTAGQILGTQNLIVGVGLLTQYPIVKFITLLSSILTASGSPLFSSLLPQSLFSYIGLITVGLTIIPMINLVIVDVFIIDFSQAIGERMDLLNLLVRVL